MVKASLFTWPCEAPDVLSGLIETESCPSIVHDLSPGVGLYFL